MINPEEAKQIILESTEKLESVELNLIESTNKIASENILTKLDLPIWNNSSMDGFAFISVSYTHLTLPTTPYV